MKLISFILILAASLNAQTMQQRYASYGELIVTQISSAPFPHPLRSAGRSYGPRFFPADKHYNDSSVAIFIPKNFRQARKIDIVIHFHGWFNNIDSTLQQFRLIEQFVESGKNAILVVPEGPKNAADSFGGKLEDKDGFKKFIDEVVAFLVQQKKVKTGRIGNIILSGHSGGYHVMSYILMHGGIPDHVKEVYLLDALYGETEKYAYWLDHYKGKMVNIYTDSGRRLDSLSGTKYETELLMADLKGWGIPYYAAEELDATSKDLAKNKLIFLHTKLQHNEVVAAHNNFREYLKASCLKERKK